MLRIDFFGPMGAGKSSLVSEVSRLSCASSSTGGRAVRTAQQEKKRILLAEARAAGLPAAFLLHVLVRLPSLEKNLILDKITNSAWVALNAHEHELRPFLSCALSRAPGETMNTSHLVRRMFYFVRDVADYALFLDRANDNIILYDESLTQRALGFVFGDSEAATFIQEYCRVLPKPTLAVHLTGDPKLLHDRVAGRTKMSTHHTPHLAQSVELCEQICEHLLERDVAVLTLNAAAPLSENARLILEELS